MRLPQKPISELRLMLIGNNRIRISVALSQQTRICLIGAIGGMESPGVIGSITKKVIPPIADIASLCVFPILVIGRAALDVAVVVKRHVFMRVRCIVRGCTASSESLYAEYHQQSNTCTQDCICLVFFIEPPLFLRCGMSIFAQHTLYVKIGKEQKTPFFAVVG